MPRRSDLPAAARRPSPRSPVIGCWPLAIWTALLAPVGCAPVGDIPRPLPGPVADAPPIRDGLRTEPEALAAASLLAEGEEHLQQGRFVEARDLAVEVEARYPEAVGSGGALWLRARASSGLEDWEEARSSVERFIALFDPDAGADPPASAILLLSETLWWTGSPNSIPVLFEVSTAADETVLAAASAHATLIARAMDTQALRELTDDAPDHPRIVSAFLVELAVRRYLVGDEAEARLLAGDALAMAPNRPVAERAMSVLEGRVDEEMGTTSVLGAIVPGSGSPGLRQLGQEILDGIEVALTLEREMGLLPPELVSRPDDGDPSRVQAAVQLLESSEAVGVIGPLLDGMVDVAVGARVGALPIVSPTAVRPPPGVPGVLSLQGVDPEAGRTLARLVLDQEVMDVVVLHPATSDMYEEARWFREEYEAGGGLIRRTFTYSPGTTAFGPHLAEVVRMAPPGLVMLLPPTGSDIQLLAPQVAFYEVREIEGLTLFGNEAWTTEAALQVVQMQHTNGVLAVTTWPEPGSFGPAWDDFVALYEDHFQRTLRSFNPALGYDAARLLITAARGGGGHPAGTSRVLNEIRDFPGATGILSVRDGRIVRTHFPVRIENRRLVALSP